MSLEELSDTGASEHASAAQARCLNCSRSKVYSLSCRGKCCRKRPTPWQCLGYFCLSIFALFIIALEYINLLIEEPCKPTSPGCGTPFDIRVTKGFGSKDYNQVRVTVISTNATPPIADFFTYSARFMYKWTENHVHTTMMTVDSSASLLPGVLDATVRLPARGAGVAGVLIADPCVDSEYGRVWVPCIHGDRFKTIERIPALLNAFVGDKDTDYWGLLGDNWYDRSGEITTDVHNRISLKVKSKIFYAVPGNHDYWAYGNPLISSTSDQCGNGFMQYYGQDSKAAENDDATASPFDFSVDPDHKRFLRFGCNRAHYTNFFWYNQIGNIGLIGQSGAYSQNEVGPFLQEACDWLGRQGPSVTVALLVGHWDVKGEGADNDMAMPAFYKSMRQLPGCKEYDDRGMLTFVTGHTHCNSLHPEHSQVGVRVAGFGMEGNACTNFGIPIFDTTADRLRWWYFDTSTDALYEQVLECVKSKGWRQCTDAFATLWLDQSIAAPTEPVVVEL